MDNSVSPCGWRPLVAHNLLVELAKKLMEMTSEQTQNANITASGVADAPSDVGGSEVTNVQPSISPKQRLKVANWNILTSTNRLELLADVLLQYGVDVCVCTEAKIPASGSKTVCSTAGRSCFECYYSGGETKKYGVAFMVSKALSGAVTHFEAINDRIAVLELNGTVNVSIVGVYAPQNERPDAEKDQFYTDLQTVVATVPKSHVMMVIGDLNAETGSDRTGWSDMVGPYGYGSVNDNSLRMMSFGSQNDLVLSNSWFRHKRAHRITFQNYNGTLKKQIDHFMICRRFRSTIQDVRAMPGARIGSDHTMVLAKLRLRLQKCTKGTFRPKPDVACLKQAEKREQFRLEVANRFDALSGTAGIEEEWRNIKSVLNGALTTVCPPVRIRKRPWISDATLSLVNERKVAKSRTRRNALNRRITSALKADEEQWWNHKATVMEAAARRGDSKTLYDTLRSLTKKKEGVSESIKSADGVPLKSKVDRVDRWASYFEQLLNRPDPSVPDSDLFEDLDEDDEVSLMRDSAPTMDEVETAIRSLKQRKSPGIDDVPPEALLHAGVALQQRIHRLLGVIWNREHVPQDWKDAVVVPVHKKGARTDCSNYRGISLLSIAGKILTSIIRSRLSEVYEANLREEQAGFRSGRGCVDQIFNLRQVFERRIRHGRPFGALFVDFSAAFDSVHRESLWAALRKAGIPVKIVKMLRALYSGGNNMVRVYGQLSRCFHVRSGVRQGCIDSPSLFNIVLDWILRKAVRGVSGVIVGQNVRVTDFGYADDLVYLGETQSDIQLFLENLDRCARKLGLMISVKKTQLVSSIPMYLFLQGEAIESVDSFVYLGSTFARGSVVASKEIERRIGMASSQFGRLRQPLFGRQDVAIATKMRVYNSAIIPILLYAAETWVYTAEDLRRLEVFNMRCMRSMLGVSLRDHIRNEDIRNRCCNQPTLESTIRSARLRWFGHVTRMDPERHPRRIFQSGRPAGWNCPATAPRVSWQRHICEDLKRGGLQLRVRDDPIEVAGEMATNRSQWRAFVRDVSLMPPTAGHR